MRMSREFAGVHLNLNSSPYYLMLCSSVSTSCNVPSRRQLPASTERPQLGLDHPRARLTMARAYSKSIDAERNHAGIFSFVL